MANLKHSDDRIAKMKFVKRPTLGNLADPRLRYDYTNREIGTLPEDGRASFKWVSEVAYKNIHRIVSRGYDTTELVEAGYGMCDVLFVDFQARIPFVEERQVLDYLLLVGLEDGLSNPALIARLIARGKNYITQSCGGSILAFGHSYASYDATGKMLNKYLAKVEEEGMSVADAAALLVKENKKEDHFGISDLYLKDPTARRILDFVEKKLAGVRPIKYVPFMKEVVKAAKAELGNVDVDMIGAMTSAMMDIGFSPEAAWCILSVTRAFAAGSHAIEELEREDLDVLGKTLTPKEWYDGPADREVPSLSDRSGFAGTQAKTPKEWQDAWKEKEKLKGTGYSIDFYIEDPRKVVSGKK